MAPLYADANCVLKVDVHCEVCKKKTMEILSSIVGVYSVTIDADEKIATIYGEVDPKTLLRAIATSGRHAELIRLQVNHPKLNRNRSYDRGRGHVQGYLEDSYDHRNRRTLPENSYGNLYNPVRKRALPDYPSDNTNYICSMPAAATWVPSYPPREYDPYDDEPINCCTVM